MPKKLLNSEAEAKVVKINRAMSVLVVFGLPILVQGIKNGRKYGTKKMVDSSINGIAVNICLSLLVAFLLVLTNVLTTNQTLVTAAGLLVFSTLVVLLGSRIGHLITRHHLN